MKVRNYIKQHFEKAHQRGWIKHFAEAALKYDFPLALLMAIASRETNMSNIKGDFRKSRHFPNGGYHGYGIMQVDIGTDPQWILSGRWVNDVRAAILHGAKILNDKKNELNRMWQGQRSLKDFLWTMAASYNTGSSRAYPSFKNYGNPDRTTTGKDYGRDVLQRMAEFKFLLDEAGITAASYAMKGIADTAETQPMPVVDTTTPAPVGDGTAAGTGTTIVQTGDENTIGGTVQPVKGGASTDPIQVLPTTEVPKEAWYSRMWSAILAFFALVGISLNELWYGAKTALSDNPTALIISVLVIVGIVAIVWKIQDNRTLKEEAEKQRAHERDMQNLKAAQDPKQINVAAVPAAQVANFVSELSTTGQTAVPYGLAGIPK